MTTRALITMQDYEGWQYTVCVDGVTSLEETINLADIMSRHSMAAVISVKFQKEMIYNRIGVSGGFYDTVRQSLSITLRSDESEKMSFVLPAPNDACLDQDQEGSSVALKSIKTALDAATGKTWSIVTHGLTSLTPPFKR